MSQNIDFDPALHDTPTDDDESVTIKPAGRADSPTDTGKPAERIESPTDTIKPAGRLDGPE